MKNEKLIRQLFVGKVAEFLGEEKTTKLLEEAIDAIGVIPKTGIDTEWKLLKDEKPPLRDCDKNSSEGFSLPIIVFDGKSVIDDCVMYFKKPSEYLANKEIKYKFWVHNFGYDNDCYEVDNVTHWMLLPGPPPKNIN